MAKNLKLNIKNTQIAQAIDLGGLKSKLAAAKPLLNEPAEQLAEPTLEKPKRKAAPKKEKESAPTVAPKTDKDEASPRVRARSKSVFSEPTSTLSAKTEQKESKAKTLKSDTAAASLAEDAKMPRQKTSEELRKEIFGQEAPSAIPLARTPTPKIEPEAPKIEPKVAQEPPIVAPKPAQPISQENPQPVQPAEPAPLPLSPPPRTLPRTAPVANWQRQTPQREMLPREITHREMPPKRAPQEKLGPTGRHIKDLAPPPRKPPEAPVAALHAPAAHARPPRREATPTPQAQTPFAKAKPKAPEAPLKEAADKIEGKKLSRPLKGKDFKDVKPVRKPDMQATRSFDARDRQGLRTGDEDRSWRRRRPKQQVHQEEDTTIRPSALKVRIPIAIKDLAAEMKLKASQLIAKLFMQGVIVTLNDFLEDETTIQLLGHEFGCEISIDTSEEQRLRITDKSIKDEISQADSQNIATRAPIVAFMGHVDHGKTSLIDYIRKSNRAAGEAGAITQHIGAFKCQTAVGDIAILDTPGHEAFSAMRARGADVTDIVVLVIAGDEGIRQQTVEAIQHAKAANVTLVVAINKCDKPNFDAETVYRQLSEQELLPEAWGGEVITVNCSAATGEGVQNLLEMLALQAEVLELKADTQARARGTVLESEMHKGMGSVATVLVQNGTLHLGDALVFGQTWGRVKTMRDEYRKDLKEAGPSTPVEITGLSGLPEAGEEFIVVKTEREARDIAEGRMQGIKQNFLQMKKKLSVENLFQQASDGSAKKVLNIVLRADVQGSLEALKSALLKIESKKAELNIIFAGVGEISESDVQLAAASKAIILGFHTQIESHADILVKQLGVQVRLHDIIYHAIDEAKLLLAGMLDKIAVETEKGKAEIKAAFKSSQYGVIAGCQVIEGSIVRKFPVRLKRGNEVVWKGNVASLKRVKEDVSEVTKGLECGIVLNGNNNFQIGDIIESYEITYVTQEL